MVKGPESVRALALSSGFPYRDTHLAAVSTHAARMLASYDIAVPVSFAGGVLEVLMDHVPSPDEFTALTRSCSSPFTVTLAPAEIIYAARVMATASATATHTSLSTLADEVFTLTHNTVSARISPGQRVRVFTGSQVTQTSHVISHETFIELLASRTASSAVLDSNLARWRVSYTAQVITLDRIADAVSTLAALGAPSLVDQVLTAPQPLIVVSSAPRAGRTSLAFAIAKQLGRPMTVLAHPTELTLPDADVISTSEDVVSALRMAPLALVDSVTDADIKAALSAALSGVRVILVLPAPSMRLALERITSLVSFTYLASVWGASVHVDCVTDANMPPVFVYSAALATPASVSLLCTASTLGLPRCWDAASSLHVITETSALANAVRSSRVRREVAANFTQDLPRFTLALGGWEEDSPSLLSPDLLP